jgi:uncharacterized protein YndB with AHSA1/START domain
MARMAVVRREPLEIELEREIEAQREVVFAAWSSAEHLAKWWGPDGFTLPRCELDFRTGGAFLLVMRGPDGAEFPYQGRFEEVTPPERLVMAGAIHDGNMTRTVVTFAERDGRTVMSIRQTFTRETESTRGVVEGWSQSLDRLARAVER